MARLLFAAHDLGGAHMLALVIMLASERGHDVVLLAAGLARTSWRGLDGMRVEVQPAASDIGRQLALINPDLVDTGNSDVATLERDAWVAARGQGIGSVAAIEAELGGPEG